MSFRLLLSPPARGAYNMAVDEALMDSVREGGAPVLRFYRWEPACLSLGRNQPAAEWYDRDEIARRGLDVVRRPTGGRAVVHARELTYSVVTPERMLGTLRHSYVAINQALLAGLRRLGVAAALQTATGVRAPVPSMHPCFRDPAEGEVVIQGRKLIGSAQLRQDGVLLQHGSLLLHDDQSILAGIERRGRREPDLPPAVLADHHTPLPSWETLTGSLADGWREVVAGPLQRAVLTPAEMARAQWYLRKHTDLEWIWRR